MRTQAQEKPSKTVVFTASNPRLDFSRAQAREVAKYMLELRLRLKTRGLA